MAKQITGDQIAEERSPHKPRKVGPITDEIRTEIVTRLARYDKPAHIHRDLLERGVQISLPAIVNYNPERAFTEHHQRWTTMFHDTRAQWIKDIAAEPAYSKAWRVRRLTELYETNIAAGDTEEARKALEAIAKEVGGVFTNVSKVQGSLLPGQMPAAERETDEMKNMLADRIKDAIEKVRAQGSVQTPTVQ